MKFRLTAPPEDKAAFAAVHKQWTVLTLTGFLVAGVGGLLFHTAIAMILPIAAALLGLAHGAQKGPGSLRRNSRKD